MSGLFGPDVGPAPVPDELAALAAAVSPRLHLGTSSWTFPGWSGIVWDRPTSADVLVREGLAAYAAHPLLRSVGIDRTFYGPVGSDVFAGWADQVPADFRFLVKAHGDLTTARVPNHPKFGSAAGQPNPRFLDAGYAVERVVGPAVDGLGDKLGVVLFQFPPTPAWHVDAFAERLHGFLSALPAGPGYAVEIRTPAWMSPAYADALVDAGVSHAYVSHPAMPPIAEQLRQVRGGARAGLVVRWMLRRDLEYGEAKQRFAPFAALAGDDPDTRDQIARLVNLALGREKRVIVIANNKAEGSAPLTLRALAERIVSLDRTSETG